jgi:hypothetical protein
MSSFSDTIAEIPDTLVDFPDIIAGIVMPNAEA